MKTTQELSTMKTTQELSTAPDDQGYIGVELGGELVEVSYEWKHSGLELSTIYKGYLRKRLYVSYNEYAAMELFIEYLETLNK